jgi:hypothetical protein
MRNKVITTLALLLLLTNFFLMSQNHLFAESLSCLALVPCNGWNAGCYAIVTPCSAGTCNCQTSEAGCYCFADCISPDLEDTDTNSCGPHCDPEY